jgi:hypothetical protein
MIKDLKNTPKILALDISTTCTGLCIFNLENRDLLELSHFSPKIKESNNKIHELLLKANLFEEKIKNYIDCGIETVVIEEPLLNSNNIYTVQTLLRYNTMLSKLIFDTLNIVPEYISTYNARSYAFPNLMQPNKSGKKVLFGSYPKDIDKKHVIWEHVNAVLPEIEWIYDKKGKLKKENYDMADAITCAIGYLNMEIEKK